ncbi:hypothetical protein D3870_21315 [Noviherbaspirillum cavernae]|uniref:Uncharacterized protein n=1 Tax=Noviherbaspirillum cavernae TaxID=2320862 RepID=A0A418WWJ7_9BURK|nr:hypothetical protein [Noviherbaspirillum cavernae]RJF96911.1 hypothetical protein D3870_21315 [Noviherbaspirillum cavernae]
MRMVLEALVNGNDEIVEHFAQAKARWTRLLANASTVSVDELAEKLTSEQFHFERNCGGRYLGKVIMGWSGFITLYSCQNGYEGDNGRLAYKLAKSFANSSCSLEVKHAAKKAAEMYHVSEYAEV